MIGQSIRAREIPLSGSMRLVSPADAVISHVIGIKAAEAASLAEVAAATPEPEVVKKGKKEEAAAPEKKDEKKKK